MKKYSKPMLDIIEFDNMDVIVMSQGSGNDEPDDAGADEILKETPMNSDPVVTPEGHEESVEPTPGEGNPMGEPTSEPEQPVEEPVEESVEEQPTVEHEENSASDDILS